MDTVTMTFYKVELREYASRDTDPPLVFFCWADDADHAIEQMMDMYPNSRCLSWSPASFTEFQRFGQSSVPIA